MAETRPSAPPIRQSGEPDPNWVNVATNLDAARASLESLVAQGAKACLPGHVVEARLNENRATRELHGGLPSDAAGTLDTQWHRLGELKGRLHRIRGTERCRLDAGAFSSPDATAANATDGGQ